MENLINLDIEIKVPPKAKTPLMKPPMELLVPVRVGAASVNSTETVVHLSDPKMSENPFDFLILCGNTKKTNSSEDLIDGSLFTFDCFSNTSSIDSSHVAPSSEESAGSEKAAVSRSLSDPSVLSSKSIRPASQANHSVDNIQGKNQLLKLSLFNSCHSPNKSFLNASLAESVFTEARKIANRFAGSGDFSFEDLNNVSQTVLGDISDVSFMDPDLQAMNLKVLKNNSMPSSTPASADKIAMFQEQLKRIKHEVVTDEVETPIEIKHEASSTSLQNSLKVKIEVEEEVKADHNEDSNKVIKEQKNDDKIGDTNDDKIEDKTESELDGLLNKLKSVINDGNKDAAKKHLSRLNELLGAKKEQSEAKNTLHVQPIVRQDTFEIDLDSGKRKYNSNEETEKTKQKTETEDIMEKLAKLLSGQSLNVHSVDLGNGDTNGAKLVFVVPTPVTTPMKNPRMSIAQRSQSAMKTMESKRLGTPMKRTPQVSRPSTFTTPRPMTTTRVSTNPYEQKLGVQSRVGAVRKSLLSSIEKSPQVQKAKAPSATGAGAKLVSSHATARRSISMKASIPAVQVTRSSPIKAVPRPSTGAPYATANRRLSHVPPIRPITSRLAPTPSKAASSTRPRTMSEHKKPVSQFKAPSALRRAAATTAGDDNGSLV